MDEIIKATTPDGHTFEYEGDPENGHRRFQQWLNALERLKPEPELAPGLMVPSAERLVQLSENFHMPAKEPTDG